MYILTTTKKSHLSGIVSPLTPHIIVGGTSSKNRGLPVGREARRLPPEAVYATPPLVASVNNLHIKTKKNYVLIYKRKLATVKIR